ncbi:hypothetical protein CW697_11640 [Macrococcoides caseolyticum]|uniref:DUF5327 family protein n=1 Tax=Macrococcoides caseolyticum TaxID=69966 RepID=UPI000C32EB05|nr:DUF5327 family protein [Macrococcus caseolyticus]PKE30601.1 hypothetical protein CW668_10885 [Macrococcus caseolyticus]PKF28762.1 hypothetical protein CW697_11640 [Macrococcus caseolyticus]
MNTKLIQKLSEEVEALKRASTVVEFNKHLYAIELIANIGQSETKSITNKPAYMPAESPPVKQTGPHEAISPEELKMMGAKVVSNDSKIKTDDGFGNGDSIFDF